MTHQNFTFNSSVLVCKDDVHGDVDFIASLLYLPFAAWGVVLAWQIYKTRSMAAESIVLIMVTTTCLVGSLLLRAMWFLDHCLTKTDVDDGWVASVLGTFALLLFFSAFSVYVFSWARSMNKERAVMLRRSLIFGNLGLYALVTVLTVVFAVDDGGDYLVSAVTDSDVIHLIIAVSDLLLCIAFAAFGSRALKLMTQIRVRTRTKSNNMGWRMWATISLCCTCFFLKTVLLIWRAVTMTNDDPNQTITTVPGDGVIYPWLDYVLPEIAPAAMILFLFHRTAMWRQRRLSETLESGLRASPTLRISASPLPLPLPHNDDADANAYTRDNGSGDVAMSEIDYTPME